jgi:hypothetical protein
MRFDFDRVGRLASTAFDFVREQSKKSVSEFARTATMLFRDFLGLAGAGKKAVSEVLGFSGSVRGDSSRDFEKEAFTLSDGLKTALMAGISNGQGLIVSGAEQCEELQKLAEHLKGVDSVDLGDGVVLRSIEDREGQPGESLARILWASSPTGSKSTQFAVTEVPSSPSDELDADVVELHLARSVSLGRDLTEVRLPSTYGPQGSRNDADQQFVRIVIRSIQSAPDLGRLGNSSIQQEVEHLARSFSSTAVEELAPVEPAGLPELSLVGKTPAQVQGNLAYRQPQLADSHCGVMAVNGFFQAQVIQPGDLVREVIQQDTDLQNSRGGYGGAFHSKLINGFKNGDAPVQISKHEFNQGRYKNFVFGDQGLDDQWGRLHNAVLGHEAPKGESLHVSPGHWLSARGGVEAEPIVGVVNQLLRSRESRPEVWRGYPSEVDSHFFLTPDARHEFVEHLKKSQVDRMLCFTEQGKHWFSMVKSDNGSWLRLDRVQEGPSLGAQGGVGAVKDDLQVGAEELSQRLDEWKVLEVVCDKTLTNALLRQDEPSLVG